MRRTIVTGTWLFAFALISSVGIASAQDAAQVKKGHGGLRRAEMLGLPRHRG